MFTTLHPKPEIIYVAFCLRNVSPRMSTDALSGMGADAELCEDSLAIDVAVPAIENENPALYTFWLEYDLDSNSLWQLSISANASDSEHSTQLLSTDADTGESELVYSLPSLAWTGVAYDRAGQYLFLIECSLTRLIMIDLSLLGASPLCNAWSWSSEEPGMQGVLQDSQPPWCRAHVLSALLTPLHPSHRVITLMHISFGHGRHKRCWVQLATASGPGVCTGRVGVHGRCDEASCAALYRRFSCGNFRGGG